MGEPSPGDVVTFTDWGMVLAFGERVPTRVALKVQRVEDSPSGRVAVGLDPDEKTRVLPLSRALAGQGSQGARKARTGPHRAKRGTSGRAARRGR
jgi:hypothetical protein